MKEKSIKLANRAINATTIHFETNCIQKVQLVRGKIFADLLKLLDQKLISSIALDFGRLIEQVITMQKV